MFLHEALNGWLRGQAFRGHAIIAEHHASDVFTNGPMRFYRTPLITDAFSVEAMLRESSPEVMGGQLKAADIVEQVLARRNSLLGLDIGHTHSAVHSPIPRILKDWISRDPRLFGCTSQSAVVLHYPESQL